MKALQPGRLHLSDILRLASYGLRARPLRVILSALGIAIGIAAMVAVVGISSSSRAELNRMLDRLGTNLLTVAPGTSLFGEAATLPEESVAMIGYLADVEAVSAMGQVPDTHIYRHDKIPAVQSGGMGVYASRLDLLDTLGATVAEGTWFNAATAQYPTVVLGARAAARLGIGATGPDTQVWLGGQWFTVIGVLDPVSLVPGLDLGAFVCWPAAERHLDFEIEITSL